MIEINRDALLAELRLVVSNAASIADSENLRSDHKVTGPDMMEEMYERYPVDVRLRVHNGDWELLFGLSDYDTDHRGSWSDSTVHGGISDTDLSGIADDLISEVTEAVQEDERDAA